MEAPEEFIKKYIGSSKFWDPNSAVLYALKLNDYALIKESLLRTDLDKSYAIEVAFEIKDTSILLAVFKRHDITAHDTIQYGIDKKDINLIKLGLSRINWNNEKIIDFVKKYDDFRLWITVMEDPRFEPETKMSLALTIDNYFVWESLFKNDEVIEYLNE